jgi:protein ImuB
LPCAQALLTEELTVRFACLLVPRAPLVALLRKASELRNLPVAVFSNEGSSTQAKLVCVSREAESYGVTPGISLRRATALCPDILLHERLVTDIQRLETILLELAFTCSPRAALAGTQEKNQDKTQDNSEAAVFFDASGIANLFRNKEGIEERYATQALDRARQLEIPAIVSIAASRQVALLAARSQVHRPGHFYIIPSGKEQELLAPLPLDLLQPSKKLSLKMERFGMACIGDLLCWPRKSVLARRGKEGLALAALARGEDCDTPLTAQLENHLEEVLELEFPLSQLEPLYFVLQGLLSKLLKRVALRGLTCDRLELSLQLEEGSPLRQWLHVAAPTLNVKVFLRSARVLFEETPPSSAVTGLCLRTQGLPPCSDQLDFFRNAGPAPALLQELVAELESYCGPGRVGSAGLLNDHRPDSFQIRSFPVTSLTHENASEAYGDPSLGAPHHSLIADSDTLSYSLSYDTVRSPQASALALRVLRPPVVAEVRIQSLGRPTWIRSAVTQGKLLFVAGPWRSTGMWWSHKDRFAFDYFDVHVSDGTLARLRHDRLQNRWELDALYD